MEVIDAKAAELSLPSRGVDLATSTEADETATRLSFNAADDTRTTQTLLGGVFEMQDDAIVPLGEYQQRRDGLRIKEIAQDDYSGALSQ
jgi:hypothetical protein